MRSVTRTILTTMVLVAPALANAQAVPTLTPDQKGYIVYHQCIMYAAIAVSHGPASDEEVFPLAKAQCAATRAAVVVGQEHNRDFLAALDAADAEKAANFPAWIKGVRERRRQFEAGAQAPTPPR